MYSCKLSVLAVLIAVGCASAAPFLEDVGRKLHDFGQKAIPAVRGVCGFVNGYQGHPPQGYPQMYPVYYPPRNAQGYPQFPQIPQYPGYYPQFPGSFPPSSIPGTNQKPSIGATEQDDLNKSAYPSGFNGSPPVQFQDIFKNFGKAPQAQIKDVNQVADPLTKYHID